MLSLGMISHTLLPEIAGPRCQLSGTPVRGVLSATNGFLSQAAAYVTQNVEKRSPATVVCPEDEALMLRIQNGDEEALGLLLERYANICPGHRAQSPARPGRSRGACAGRLLSGLQKMPAVRFQARNGAGMAAADCLSPRV